MIQCLSTGELYEFIALLPEDAWKTLADGSIQIADVVWKYSKEFSIWCWK